MKKLVVLACLALCSCSVSVKSLDPSKLLIGVPSVADGFPVVLGLTFKVGSAPAVSASFSSEDLPVLDGQDPSARFLDLAFWSSFYNAVGDLTFGAWLGDPANSLTAATSALGGLVVSSPVTIGKAGVWFVSAALEDGQAPYGFDPSSDGTYQPCYVVKGGQL
jgi:hypothetical protein